MRAVSRIVQSSRGAVLAASRIRGRGGAPLAYRVTAAAVAAGLAATAACDGTACEDKDSKVPTGVFSPRLFDHTILKPEATVADVDKVCDEALEHGFYSVCVNSSFVGHVAERLRGSDVKVCAVVGFPLGAMMTAAKVVEAQMAMSAGALEIDMVANIGMLRSGDYNGYRQDIEAIAQVCKAHRAKLKVILETCLLTEEEKNIAARLALSGGADFLKTSTGFSTGGATTKDVELLSGMAHRYFATRLNERGQKKVTNAYCKASGGIRSGATALQMLEAGADRLGTSGTVKVYEEAKELLSQKKGE